MGLQTLRLLRREYARKPAKLAKIHRQLPERAPTHRNALGLESGGLVLRPGRLRPRGYDALRVDHALPGNRVVVEARVRVLGQML